MPINTGEKSEQTWGVLREFVEGGRYKALDAVDFKLECQYFLGTQEVQQTYNRLEHYRVFDSRTQRGMVRELKQRISIREGVWPYSKAIARTFNKSWKRESPLIFSTSLSNDCHDNKKF